MTLKAILDPRMGMAGDMFIGALLSLGVPKNYLFQSLERVASYLGTAEIESETVYFASTRATRLKINLTARSTHLPEDKATELLENAIKNENIKSPYADFARRALNILILAEREAHSGERLKASSYTVQAIGRAHTPYKKTDKIPYQPRSGEDGSDFYIEIFNEFAPGIEGLDSFSHIFVLSYLNEIKGYSLNVHPPWLRYKFDSNKESGIGLFASRSPNRPSPIGLTLTELKKIDGNRIYTGNLDLFDETPIIDIKPQIRSIDKTDRGNDGWLSESDHLELHKKGIPHKHAHDKATLHEAQDILIDITGAALGLQYLGIDINGISSFMPVSIGGGNVKFSHGKLSVPVPAVASILKQYRIPHVSGPVESELLTPTGASILAALSSRWICRKKTSQLGSSKDLNNVKIGFGAGVKEFKKPNIFGIIVYEE